MPALKRAHKMEAGKGRANADDAGRLDVTNRLERIFDELAEIRAMMNRLDDGQPEMTGRDADPESLWAGIEAIQQAISQTRSEISSLHANGLRDRQIYRASDELDTVVSDTEHATQSILSAAEAIGGASDLLMTRLDGDDRARVAEIHDHVIRIFEACTFQDIAGQRLSKVVSLLHFIESSVAKMSDIWVDASPANGLDEADKIKGDDDLLNGPALAGDEGIVSQDDIDSLFN
jgi:chemotaxis protein CheZ